ncbi:hypothetical protein CCH79_00013165 [Gambusia affinis]|uniref:Inosine/uridine-preferring nucleoside hydrolase domain-containing protein n=1 Tax=Gambusia affinis TaxID=33528 RepID=A0A315W971_GAMAF|nr:hypothetical protein CCH79_00013165 [Gambusia affinis]
MKKLILDVDTGVGDAQAIMIALTAPDVEVLGITAATATLLWRTSSQTPCVFQFIRVSRKPLLARKQHASDYHGKDGLRDVPDPDAPSVELLQKKKAAQAMLKITRENPGEVGKIIFLRRVAVRKDREGRFHQEDIRSFNEIDDGFITESEHVSLHRCRYFFLKIQAWLKVAVTVELNGKHTRGMMAVIMKTADLEKLKKMLHNAIKLNFKI